ncbi:MAG: integrase arm-type DNA-binding domain-containing protein [Sedimenticola sp.]
MAKRTNRLTDLKIRKQLKGPRLKADGNGLYIQITANGSKSWLYRYKVKGKDRWHGLGSYHQKNGLAEAREAVAACRVLRQKGIDPIEHARSLKSQNALEKAKGITFWECAETYIQTHKPGWRNAKHAQQWKNTLDTYAKPVIGDLSVQDIDVSLILQVLEPIWNAKTETATRVRQRIESILDWATARGYRDGENPARWRGHLEKLLPKPGKIQKTKHFSALPYSEVPEYFRFLQQKESISAKALAFIILTATRSNEARYLRWSEIDFEKKIVTIPEERMKAGRMHRIPLSSTTITLLESMKQHKREGDDLVFIGRDKGRPISEASIRNLLKESHNVTTHGFRSSFRDWCAEQTNFPREIAEQALAHINKDKVEAAYQRGDLLERRRKLMDSWESYLQTETAGKVVHISNKSEVASK